MPLKILCAGCSKDERESAEAAVRSALAGAPSGSWTVSLVKIQRQWSVTLDGPGNTLAFTAPDGGIRESIEQALRGSAGETGHAPAPSPSRAPDSAHKPVPAPSPSRAPARAQAPAAPAAASGEQRDRHQCQKCDRAFYVAYAASSGASQERVAAACPHCWHVNYVMVSEEAAWNRDYRAEKAD